MLIRANHILMMTSDKEGQCCSAQILQQVLHKGFIYSVTGYLILLNGIAIFAKEKTAPRVVALGSYGAINGGFCSTALSLYSIHAPTSSFF